MDSPEPQRAPSRRLVLAAGASAAILPLLFHLPYFSGDRILYSADTAQLQYPRYKVLCDALQQEGALPLWQTWLYTGAPFHANPENPTLYPPVVLLASFCTPVWTINLTILFHLALAGLGMFLLVRRLWTRLDAGGAASSAGLGGALVAACMFSLSYWTRVDHLNLVAYGATHALIPWVLLASDSLLNGARPLRTAGVLGLLLGFQVLSGGLYVITYLALVLGAWMLFLGLLGGTQRALRTVTYGVLAVLVAGLLVCGKALPYLEWIPTTNRAAQLDYAEVLGTTLGTGKNGWQWIEVWKRVEMYTCFGGSLVLALLALPLVRFAVVRLAFALTVWFVLIALGGPVHRWMYEWVPIFDQTRSAVRAWTGVNAMLPILVGLGTCGILARFAGVRERPSKGFGVGLALALLLAPCFAYSFRHHDVLTHPERFSELPRAYVRWPDAARLCGKEWRAMYVDRDAPHSRNEQFISTLLEVETPAGYLGHVWPRDLELHLYGTEADPLADQVRFRRRSTLSVKWMISTSHEPGAPEISSRVLPPGVDGNVLVENPIVRPRAIEPAVVAGVYGDEQSAIAYALLDTGEFPLRNASTLQFAPERALSPAELEALDALVLCGSPGAPALAAANALRAAGKPVLEIALPLSAESRARVQVLEHQLALAELARPAPSVRFERVHSGASALVRGDSARGRWIVVSEPWAIYAGWEARSGSGAPVAIDRADGVSSAVFLPAGESSLRAEYAPAPVRLGLWIHAAGVLLGLLLVLWPARSR